MDLRSHTTPDLALRGALAAFPAHPKLPLRTTAYMALRHQEAREQGHTATADRLARLAASDAAAATVDQFSRRIRKRDSPRAGDFLYPTVLVVLWRDADTRPELRRLLRKGLKRYGRGITWQEVRSWLQSAADHEREHREILLAFLLTDLAEKATQPDECTRREIEMHRREAARQQLAAEALRAHGLADQASEHTERAIFHDCYAQNLAHEWTPNADALIRRVRFALGWPIECLGYESARKLIDVALDRR